MKDEKLQSDGTHLSKQEWWCHQWSPSRWENNNTDRARMRKESWMVLLLLFQFSVVYILRTKRSVMDHPSAKDSSYDNNSVTKITLISSRNKSSTVVVFTNTTSPTASRTAAISPFSSSKTQLQLSPTTSEISNHSADAYNSSGAIDLNFTCPPDVFFYLPPASTIDALGGSPPKTIKKRNITMIVVLKGQTGNNLSFFARAYGIKRSIERKYRIDSIARHKREKLGNSGVDDEINIQIVAQHQGQSYSENVANELKICFPNMFSDMQFDSGIWDTTGAYNRTEKRQREWLNAMIERQKRMKHFEIYSKILAENKPTRVDSLILDRPSCVENMKTGMYCWKNSYCHLQAMLQQQLHETENPLIQQTLISLQDLQQAQQQQDLNNTSSISLPYLTSKGLRYHGAVDEYYNEIRQLFNFNEGSCCQARSEAGDDSNSIDPPYDDEIVLHVRMFEREILGMGFHELNPKQIATLLFTRYDFNRSIAIVSREQSTEYVSELRQRGFVKIRQVHLKTPMEDFCFMMRTKYHLIALKMSTFAAWAGLLSNATKLRFYSVNSTYTRRSSMADGLLNHYQWKNNDLKQRIDYEIYEV